MITDINSEDRLVQQTFADYLHDVLGWDSLYAWNHETFGAHGTLGRDSEREVVLVRDLRAALARLNSDLPESAHEQAVEKLTRVDFSRSLLQHNREYYGYIRDGVPVQWRDAKGQIQHARAQVIDFHPGATSNRFLAVRELKIQGMRVPHYNRRADLVCFVNGLPLVFIELKAVYRNIRAGFDHNLTDYLHEHSIAHAFHHNAFLIVSNGDRARYGSITSKWEHFVEWKRNDEAHRGDVDTRVLLNGMLAHDRLLDLVENFMLFDDSKPGGTRKIVARNHQVLGVNNAVASVQRQEELKRQFPPPRRLVPYTIQASEVPLAAEAGLSPVEETREFLAKSDTHDLLPLVQRTHPDLGRLGVFWHTQGSGKSYSMAFLAEKVRRVVPGNKITCARMLQRIEPRWQGKLAQVKVLLAQQEAELAAAPDPAARERLVTSLEKLRGQVHWMDSTIIEIIISEAQNEVRDFQQWGFDIIPHRVVMKQGFQTPDGRRVAVENAFKDPQHPFRIAIVCAMWLTGFDVECLSTLYIDKPMQAHTLMPAIARANRVYPGKDCGVIVDYNGMLKSLREALAQYALGDEGDASDADDIVAPIEDLMQALVQAIETAENHLRGLGFDPVRLHTAQGFERIQALRDAVDALYTSDEAKRRFEIMARQVFIRFKALLMEPSALAYAERHDNLEAIYKKLEEKRDTADITEVLKALHKVVNEAIRAQAPGEDHAEGLSVDLSQIDFTRLRQEFAHRVQRKHVVLQDIRDIVEQKLQQMLAHNPMRMDYYKRYQEIIADYNREKDRVTVEETFARLVELAHSLDAEQRRAAAEGLSDDEYALFQMLFKDNISQADRDTLKQASKSLLASLQALLTPMYDWTKNTTTQADVRVFILDNLWQSLPRPPFTDQETEALANRVYDYVWQRSASGAEGLAA